ncbi:MAG: hypothetical protein LBT97_00985 [Planctomycetota bacterium]|nr:hypothetical protein [Planctomycetota bacterium]
MPVLLAAKALVQIPDIPLEIHAGPPPARAFACLRIVRRIAVANARLAAG